MRAGIKTALLRQELLTQLGVAHGQRNAAASFENLHSLPLNRPCQVVAVTEVSTMVETRSPSADDHGEATRDSVSTSSVKSSIIVDELPVAVVDRPLIGARRVA